MEPEERSPYRRPGPHRRGEHRPWSRRSAAPTGARVRTGGASTDHGVSRARWPWRRGCPERFRSPSTTSAGTGAVGRERHRARPRPRRSSRRPCRRCSRPPRRERFPPCRSSRACRSCGRRACGSTAARRRCARGCRRCAAPRCLPNSVPATCTARSPIRPRSDTRLTKSMADDDVVSRTDEAPCLGELRRVDEAHRLVDDEAEHALEHGEREHPAVVVGDLALVRDLERFDRTAGERGEQPAEALREREERLHGRVGLLGREVHGVGHELAAEREHDLLGDRLTRLVLGLGGRRAEVRRDDDVRRARTAATPSSARSRRRRARRPRSGRRATASASAASSTMPPRAVFTMRRRRLRVREQLARR